MSSLLGRRQANLCFNFAGSGENLPDIAKSPDASVGMKQNSFLFLAISKAFACLNEVLQYLCVTEGNSRTVGHRYRINFNPGAGSHCQRDKKETFYEVQCFSA